MNTYIKETKFATSSLIKLINSEEEELSNLINKLNEKKINHRFLYDDFNHKDFDPNSYFNEHQMIFAFNKQASYYEGEIYPLNKKIKELKSSIVAKQESIKSLSGALLQIAKQGISIVHGNLGGCPNGRIINDEILKSIIWQGRNQSMHYEEGNFNPQVKQCFKKINIKLGSNNLAKEIINLLDWKNYLNYEKDLKSLLDYQG